MASSRWAASEGLLRVLCCCTTPLLPAWRCPLKTLRSSLWTGSKVRLKLDGVWPHRGKRRTGLRPNLCSSLWAVRPG